MAVEANNCDLVAQRSNDVSGATMALTDLNSRLTDLVEQLISSYNISEDELEVSILDKCKCKLCSIAIPPVYKLHEQ